MFISFRMNGSIYFSSSLCIQISIRQGNKDSLFAQINFFGPTIKEAYLHERKQFLNIINVESNFPPSLTISRDTRLAKLQKKRRCWPWIPMKRKSAVIGKKLGRVPPAEPRHTQRVMWGVIWPKLF